MQSGNVLSHQGPAANDYPVLRHVQVHDARGRRRGAYQEGGLTNTENLHTSLKLILDCVDYVRGNCRVNEMVGAVLPTEILERARKAAKDYEHEKQDALAGLG